MTNEERMHMRSGLYQKCLTLFFGVLIPAVLPGQTILSNQVHEVNALCSEETVQLFGTSELHVMDAPDPESFGKIELNSEDVFLFFHALRPSVVAEDYLDHILVDGKEATMGTNVRVTQCGEGSVIIPHGDDFEPLEVFSGGSFTGHARKLKSYVEYGAEELGPAAGAIRSFILKRGYMATFAENEDGTGASECYVAQETDLNMPMLPEGLGSGIRFIRIFPWRWVGKKGSCDIDPDRLNATWHYNWNINKKSTLDWEYVAIKQHANWPGLNQDWKAMGVNHLLGYNEPNNHVEDGYKNLNPPGSVDNAVDRWPDLLCTGLRLGSPAVTDGGRGWILDFMKKAKERNYRVDFVAIHYYRSFWKKDDPEGAARQLYNFLKDIHDQTGKPIWLTEWNNGANWTDSNHDCSPEQEKRAVAAMMKMLNETPWVERYAIYSNVEDFRKMVLNDELTPAGKIYHDGTAPFGFVQPPAPPGASPETLLLFDHSFVDSSGNGNGATAHGSPVFADIGKRTALVFDGSNDYLQLPPRSGSDDCAMGFAAWINWSGGAGQHLFSFGNDSEHDFCLKGDREGTGLELVLRQGEQVCRLQVPDVEQETWCHIAVGISSRSVRLYLDGKMVKASSTMEFEPSDLETLQNYIGRGQADSDAMFCGQMLQLQLYARDLTDAAVRKLAERVSISFAGEPLKYAVSVGMNFSGSLKGTANGGRGRLRYEMAAGPDWLTILEGGRMEGRPTEADEGLNRFIVLVTDDDGRMNACEMTIDVRRR